MESMKLIVIKFAKTDVFRAYFDGTPNFYGEGKTREAAVKQLVEKMYAVLEAYANITKDM
jgi:predicted RNase H-like HicB family nuclease